MDVIEFRPERDQYAFTFGGVAPVRKVQPGTMLRLWTDDAFCGNLREPSDMCESPPSLSRHCHPWPPECPMATARAED